MSARFIGPISECSECPLGRECGSSPERSLRGEVPPSCTLPVFPAELIALQTEITGLREGIGAALEQAAPV